MIEFLIGDAVKIHNGVFHEGKHLGGFRGFVVNTKSYVLTLIPALDITVKLFRHEIYIEDSNPLDEDSSPDNWSI